MMKFRHFLHENESNPQVQKWFEKELTNIRVAFSTLLKQAGMPTDKVVMKVQLQEMYIQALLKFDKQEVIQCDSWLKEEQEKLFQIFFKN